MRKRFNTRVLINIVVIVIVGIFSGYFVGNFYISTFRGGVAADLLPSEDALRDNIADVLKRANGKSVSELSAIDNYVLAEYYLDQKENVYKHCSGTVTAAGVTQTLVAKRIKIGNSYFGEEISCKTGSIGVNYAQRFYYTEGVDSIAIYNGTDIKSDSATFKNTPDVTHTMESFRAVMGISPTYFQNYIVSSKTIVDGSFVEKTVNNTYVFTLEMNANNSVKNYMYKIKATSNAKNFPSFHHANIVFEIDENWNMISIKYDEKYKVNIGISVDTVGKLTETFDYSGNYTIPQI